MTGPAAYSRDADVAARARARLDRTVALIEKVEKGQRAVVVELAGMWPDAAWLAAGARSAKQWLIGVVGLSVIEAGRLERIAELCTRNPRLSAAVSEGRLSLGRAETLGRAVTDERARFLTDSVVDAFLSLAGDDDAFAMAVRYWRERADEHLAPRRVQAHTLTYSRRLFGGGDVHASLAPVAFETFCAAVDAYVQDPDPADAPYRRTMSERRADALDDMATAALTHEHHHTTPTDPAGQQDREDELETEADRAADTYDGSFPGDTLDQALDPDNADLDQLELLRARIRKAERHHRRRASRRIRARSGVTVNVLIDLRTLLDARDLDDLDDLVVLSDTWNTTRAAVEQMTCDAALVATLFDGLTEVIDANDAAERFSKRQRRAIAARDHHCVFPGCTRPPRHCDTHHLHERADGGPTTVANGCLLCRFHHRLLHQHGWTLRRDDLGTWVATDPHGTEWRGRPFHPAAAGACA